MIFRKATTLEPCTNRGLNKWRLEKKQNELSKWVQINGNREVTFLSNSASSISLANEHFPPCQPNFLAICMFAITSTLFSNYYAFFHNVYYFKCLFLEINIQTFTVIDSVHRKNTVYTFQLKSFKHNVILTCFS